MKIYIMVDMEGISGICEETQVKSGSWLYDSSRKYLTADVNACIAGCIEGGARHIRVRFAHGDSQQFVWEQLDPRAEYINGGTHERMPDIARYDALMLVGYHAMAGTRRAVLDHTMSPRGWQNCWINGVLSGEIAIDAGIAGDHGVPTIFVSGDDKTCAEARRFLPGVVTAEVKKGLNREAAVLLPQPEAHKRIRVAALRAVQGFQKIRPYRVRRPVKMRLELCNAKALPEHRADVRIIDGHTFEVTAKSVEAALNRL